MPFLSIRGYAFVRCAVRRLRRDDRRRGALVDMLPGPRGKRGAHGPIREPAGRPTSRIPGNRSRTERGWAVMRGRARPHHRGLPVEPKTRGAWVVHHADKLERVVNRTDFENIEHAGKAGQFLSALACSEDVALDNARVEALAKANNIPRAELPAIKDTLERQKLIEVGEHGIDVLGATTGQVLKHVAGMFDSLSPTAEEEAVITLAEETSEAPLDLSTAAKLLGDTHKLSSTEALDLLGRAEDAGFVDGEEVDWQTRLLFNGHIFRKGEGDKIRNVLASLSPAEAKLVTEVSELLKGAGCVPRADVEKRLTKPVFDKLHAIGMFDVNTVENSSDAIQYVTRPQAFGKFGDPFVEDALDNAKAFVACLTYGMTRRSSSEGRISMLSALLGRLNAGIEVGPATAIGEDYEVLEMKGVVSLRHAFGSRYFMKLLKPEVGKLALKVLTDGDASTESLSSFPGAAVARYGKPEHNRAETRKNTKPSRKGQRDVLVALRSGKTR